MNKRDIENAVYNKANTYYSTVCMLAEHDVLDECNNGSCTISH